MSPEPHVGARSSGIWLGVAIGIVPVLLILPLYVFPPVEPILGRPGGSYDSRRLLELAWAALMLGSLLDSGVRRRAALTWEALPRPTRLAGGMFVAWTLLRAFFTPAPPYALREWALMSTLLAVLFPLAAILAPARREVVGVLSATLLLYAVLIAPNPLDHGFSSPRFLGQAMSVAVPVLLWSSDWTLALAAAPALAVALLNGSRALTVTMFLVSGIAWLLWRDRSGRMLPAVCGIGLALLLVAVAAALGQDAEIQAAVQRGTHTMGRSRMWTESWELFLGSPLVGVGPGMLALGDGLMGWASHPHNDVVLLVAETGLIGLILFGTAVVPGVRRIPYLEDERRPWVMGLVGGAVHGLISGTVIMPTSQVLLLVAVALALPDPVESPRSDARAPRAGWAFLLVGSVALVVVCSTLRLPQMEQPPRHGIYGPRFFQGGNIPR